jgi:hypothetical protein
MHTDEAFRHRRTLITSNRSPAKTICFTVFQTLSLARFNQSRTSIEWASPSDFRVAHAPKSRRDDRQ